jgi:hypothetical protein
MGRHPAFDMPVVRIEGRYNADNDIIPDAPVVTWTDMELLNIIKFQQKQIEDLQDKVARLVEVINGIGGNYAR